MAVSSFWYVNGIKNWLAGNMALGAGAFKVALLNSNLALNAAQLKNNTAFASVSSTQITGTNYTAGGIALDLVAANITVDATNGVVNIGNAIPNTAWTSATFSAQYAVIYHVANNWLLGIVDFGALETCSNGSFTIDWNNDALFKITPTGL